MNNMTDMLQTAFWKAFSWITQFWLSNKIRLEYVHYCIVNIKPGSFQSMAWRFTWENLSKFWSMLAARVIASIFGISITIRLNRNWQDVLESMFSIRGLRQAADLYVHTLPKSSLNALRPRHIQTHFLEWFSIKISLKFVPKGPINNNPALVQIMAWCRPGDKPLFESMMVSSLTHICVTRPQGVKRSPLLSRRANIYHHIARLSMTTLVNRDVKCKYEATLKVKNRSSGINILRNCSFITAS